MKATVSIQKCGSYSPREVKSAVRKSLLPLGGISSIVKKGETVLLKVNALAPHAPEKAVTTHPLVVRAVSQLVKGAGGKPVIGDMGFPGAASTPAVFEKSGLGAVAAEEGVPLVPFETGGFQKRRVNGELFRELFVSSLLHNTHKVIFLPKLNAHMETDLTAAVKLSFGLAPMLYRRIAHAGGKERLCRGIVDVFSVRKPDLVVMDAVVGMEGNGPIRGSPKELGLIISSNDAVAVDSVAERIICFPPSLTTRIASERGLGESSLEKIDIVGEAAAVRKKFKKAVTKTDKIPRLVRKAFVGLSMVVPTVKKERCSMCMLCMEYCPSNAIFLRGFPRIHAQKCIQCFGCELLCPEKAIEKRERVSYRLVKWARRLAGV
jgi:uncharacterized protein (DUF362 family)